MPLRRLFRPALLVVVGLGVLKVVGRWFITRTQHNPAYENFTAAAAAVGLLLFMYFFHQLVLFAAALAATSDRGAVLGHDLPAGPAGADRRSPGHRPDDAATARRRIVGTDAQGMMCAVGTLVTLDLPDDSPALTLPWIITFGPLDDEEMWEPVVCGPYERAHALALAEAVVADEELMAVVEPLQPPSPSTRSAARSPRRAWPPTRPRTTRPSDDHDHDHDDDHDHEGEIVTPSDPPSPEEIKAGFARIAERLAG